MHQCALIYTLCNIVLAIVENQPRCMTTEGYRTVVERRTPCYAVNASHTRQLVQKIFIVVGRHCKSGDAIQQLQVADQRDLIRRIHAFDHDLSNATASFFSATKKNKGT